MAAADDALKVVQECLGDPVLHPDHPGHDTPKKKQDFQKLRAALQELYGTPTDPRWTHVCGTQPDDKFFRVQLNDQLNKLKNALDLWDPQDPGVSARFDAFEAEAMALLNGLVGADKLKAEVGKDDKPVLLAGLSTRGDDEKVDPTKVRKFIIHLSSKQVTKKLIEDAYNAWLCMFHADVKVIEEEQSTDESKKILPSLDEDVHVYVEDGALTGGTPATSFFPQQNTNTIVIGSQSYEVQGSVKSAIQHWDKNIVGILTHEVGHTLGFVHERRHVGKVDYVGQVDYDYVGLSGADKLKVVKKATSVPHDPESIMFYPKLIVDGAKKASCLSKDDKLGCKFLYNCSKDDVDEYPKANK